MYNNKIYLETSDVTMLYVFGIANYECDINF